MLPVKLKEWKLGASCLKKHDAVKKCYAIKECDDKRHNDFVVAALMLCSEIL